jgi:hypothetical protein
LLEDWASREDRQSTTQIPVYRYTKGVTLIVHFQRSRAVGVAVIDNPGLGVEGIPDSRVAELVKLIGGPPTGKILRDERGVREFAVGKEIYDGD